MQFYKMFDLELNFSLLFILIISTLSLNVSELLFVFWTAILCFYYLILKFTIPFGEYGFADYMPSALVILGSGGHTWEMLNILNKIEWQRYLPIYIVAYSDSHTICDLNSFENYYKRNYFIERLTRPREHCHTSIFSPTVLYRSLCCFIESICLIYRHKPEYIISNGPSICVPPTIAASLLRKLGFINTRIVYIESAARVSTMSISARILRNFVDYMFAFWPQLCDSNTLLPLYSSQFKNCILNNNLRGVHYDKELTNKRKAALITVGTTQFSELVNVALSQKFQTFLIDQGFTHLTVQIGSLELYEEIEQRHNGSQLKIEIIKIIPSHKFLDLLKETDLVVSHGGAGTLLQALIYGKKIIVVPNQRVRDNHQLELVNNFRQLDLIFVSSADNLINFLNKNYQLINHSYVPEFKVNLNDSFKRAIGETRLKNESNYPKITENKKQFSVVIPSTNSDIGYLNNLLASIQKFLSLSSVSVVLIIVPDIDFDEMIHFLSFGESSWQKKIRLIKETEFIPKSTLSKCNSFPKWRTGWFKQQVIKLSAAFYIDTQFYLILDSDCILTSPLKYCDLICINDNIIRSFYQTEDIYLHQNWWKGSAKLLGINSFFLNSLKNGIGVTPQILSVEIVKELCSFIEKCHPNRGKWYSILCSFRLQLYPTAVWTEYTLYYLFAIRTGLLHKYHTLKRNALSNYDECVWQLHQSYDWIPFMKRGKLSSFFTIFQSNTKLSPRIAAAFLSRLIEKDSNCFISCIMILKNKKLDITVENMIRSSIECYSRQSWPSSMRELLIICDKEHEDLVKGFIKSFMASDNEIRLIKTENFNLIENSVELAKGDCIAFWPHFTWSSPYRLSVQFQYIKDLNIKSCHISPFISGDPIQKKFYLTDESDIETESYGHKISFFCKRDLLSLENPSIESKALNEPTLLININSNVCQKATHLTDAVRKLQPIDSDSHLNELIRVTGPFIDCSISFLKRKHRKIYFISSELAFSPVIGGINTFLRVIISELQNLSIHLKNNVEFVFCGIKCGDTEPAVPQIKGLTFKFFQTKNSKKSSDLEKYFKSFSKYSSTIDDIQSFGHSAMSWIKSDATPGDICVTTIVYECNDRLLKELVLRGIKLIHTVHSLVPLKIMFNCRCIPFKKLNLKDTIRAIFIHLFKLNEYKLVMISNLSFLRWILPKFITESIEKEQLMMSLSQAIFVPSKKLAKITASLYPSVKHKVRYVPWGLPNQSVIGDPLINYENDRIKSDSSTIKCLALCKLVPQKGVDLLLDAFQFIEKMDPNLANRLELNICGDMSYMEENQYFSLLQKKVDCLRRVKVNFNGWLKGQSKLDQLKEANLFVSPSLTEPFGFSLLEAMKSGLPVVSFATEGPLDIVCHEFGRIVPITQDFDVMAKDFAIAIIDLCYSNNYQQMCKASNRAANLWTLDILLENLFSIL